jgi:hypothetical protein
MDKCILAPVLLFAYTRLDLLKLSIDALRRNDLSGETDLYIFSDGPKKEEDEGSITELRKYIRTVHGFKNLHIVEANKNKGLANSIIEGVSLVINKTQKAIVLEDDLLTSTNFLSFMNQALDHYQTDENMFSISGYSFRINHIPSNDVYFTKRGSSWGWGTWADRWNVIDWKVSDFEKWKNDKRSQQNFNKMGSDLSAMLKKQMAGKMNSWAIRWVYHQYLTDTYTAYPTVSKVRNLGFGEGATHTFDYFNRYETKLDKSGKSTFVFPKPGIDKKILTQFVRKYSLTTRATYKMLNKFIAPLMSKNK